MQSSPFSSLKLNCTWDNWDNTQCVPQIVALSLGSLCPIHENIFVKSTPTQEYILNASFTFTVHLYTPIGLFKAVTLKLNSFPRQSRFGAYLVYTQTDNLLDYKLSIEQSDICTRIMSFNNMSTVPDLKILYFYKLHYVRYYYSIDDPDIDLTVRFPEFFGQQLLYLHLGQAFSMRSTFYTCTLLRKYVRLHQQLPGIFNVYLPNFVVIGAYFLFIVCMSHRTY